MLGLVHGMAAKQRERSSIVANGAAAVGQKQTLRCHQVAMSATASNKWDEIMLRIAPGNRSGGTFQDIRRDLSPEQLAGIGAIAIAWNEIEFMLDVALYSGEELAASCLQDDLPRRRLDDKIKHARKAADRWRLPADYLNSIELTASAFSDLKELRNAVIHSRVFDERNGIGHRITLKGEIQEGVQSFV